MIDLFCGVCYIGKRKKKVPDMESATPKYVQGYWRGKTAEVQSDKKVVQLDQVAVALTLLIATLTLVAIVFWQVTLLTLLFTIVIHATARVIKWHRQKTENGLRVVYLADKVRVI